jgi:hypothetical protein
MARVLVVGSGDPGSEHVVEHAEGDPDRLATLTPQLEGVSVVCWLLGDDGREALHGDRLASLLEYLVDTPVRGFVYERSTAYPAGEELVARAGRTFRLPTAVVSPGDDLAAAVERVLSG